MERSGARFQVDDQRIGRSCETDCASTKIKGIAADVEWRGLVESEGEYTLAANPVDAVAVQLQACTGECCLGDTYGLAVNRQGRVELR